MADRDPSQETPAADTPEDVVAEPSARAKGKQKTKADLLAELAARDRQIAEVYQLLADAHSRPEGEDDEGGAEQAQRRDQRRRESTGDTTTSRNTQQTTAGDGKRSAKLPDPPVFHNDTGKDTMKFEAWHRQLTKKLSVNDDHFADDAAKQAYIESRLGGKAADELMPYLGDTHPEPVDSSKKLLDHLWNEYHDTTRFQQALNDFADLKMEPGDDYQAFKNSFVRLAGETGRAKADWKAEFQHRLTPRLQTSLAVSYADPTVSFEQYAKLGATIALIDKQAAASRLQRRESAPTRGARGGRRSTPGPSERSQRPKAGTKLTADDVKRLYDEGRCFICREKGHLATDCLQKERSDRPRMSDPDRDVRVARLQKRWAAKPPEQSYKDDDSTTVADDSASEQGN
jgi:hypothetical protein